MNKEDLIKLLEDIKGDKIPIEEGASILSEPPFKDLGFAKIDNDRELRVGYPEVIYCSGKTNDQVIKIVDYMTGSGSNILGTRASRELYESVKDKFPDAKYYDEARIISIRNKETDETASYVAVVTAGTSDINVAEEAAVTLEEFGNKVERVYDVGVAGLHRLLNSLPVIRGAKVVIVIAGMEGALASVVGGLVNKPVIAVPTSIGYGANFNGLSALLSMLNSCASGVSVVNIDNGFGAGYLASIINKL